MCFVIHLKLTAKLILSTVEQSNHMLALLRNRSLEETSSPPMAHAHVQAYQVIREKSRTKNRPSFSHNFSGFIRPTTNDTHMPGFQKNQGTRVNNPLVTICWSCWDMPWKVGLFFCTGCLVGIVYTFSLLYLFYATAVVFLSTGVRGIVSKTCT